MYTGLYNTVGASAVLCLGYYLFIRKKKPQPTSLEILKNKTKEVVSTAGKSSILEDIRQIGLIAEDEFNDFYIPLIDKVERIEHLVQSTKINANYFELVFKGLRKRRSLIFEYGDSEKNNKTRELWTYAMFASFTIRYIIRLCDEHVFKDKDGNIVNIRLTDLSSLDVITDAKALNKVITYKPRIENVHIIDKIVPKNIIELLVDSSIYPYLVNAITGFYQERINPFYGSIEHVENFVLKPGTDNSENTIFKATFELVLKTIEDNYIKNKENGFIFESTTSLIVDRYFLWSLYKNWQVGELRTLSLTTFEGKLQEVYGITDMKLNETDYLLNVERTSIDDLPEIETVRISNVVTLPYSKIATYNPVKKIRLTKISRDREVEKVLEKTDETNNSGWVDTKKATNSTSKNGSDIFVKK